MLWYCIASSFLFGINSAIAYVYKHYIISGLLFALFISSVLYHTERLYDHSGKYIFTSSLVEHNKTNVHLRILALVDTIIVWMFIPTVLYLHFLKMLTRKITMGIVLINASIILTLIYMWYIYYYGYEIDDYCFHPYSYIAEKWHMSIHVLAVINVYLLFLI
jgi:hypothetical protein